MAQNLESLTELIMTTINGLSSPQTTIVQAAQDAAKNAIATAKQTAQTAKIVVPQQAVIAKEIGELELQKAPKVAEAAVYINELKVIDSTIEEYENILKETKKLQADAQKIRDRQVARRKSRGEQVNEDNQGESEVRTQKDLIEKVKEKRNDIQGKLDKLNQEVSDIDAQIAEKKRTIKVLAAQLNPKGSLTEAKEKTQAAQNKVDSAPTPEAKAEAQKELEEAQEEESIIQQISDDADEAVKNEEEKNNPKMMQLRAEFQIMDSGVSTIKYLTTNAPILITAMTVSIGANGGGPVPVLPSVSMPFGNILYGFGYFIIANVKAASIRFLALAKELEYTPTSEMTIIEQIAPVEAAWKSTMSSLAPAGVSLI